jgi:AcrR family transcriptional regulator
MPRGFTEQEKELIRGRLLEQGYRQFSAYGLRKATVDELAEAAGISKGAFYHFYASKEALFMDVVELAEGRFREEVLSVIDLPGPSPRARLSAAFRTATALFRTMPVLRSFTGGDFDLLFQRMPAEKLQEHLASDRVFFDDLIARCRDAGIPIRARIEDIRGLMYALVLMLVREDDALLKDSSQTADILVELIAAFCIGEVEIPARIPVSPAPDFPGPFPPGRFSKEGTE